MAEVTASTRLSGKHGKLAAFFSGFDVPVFLVTLALVSYGLVVVYSASLSIEEASLSRQAVGVAIGLVLLAIVFRFDYRRLERMTTFLFVLDCLLMIAPLIPGLSYSSHGITGWIRIPGIGLTFQTAEVAKPVTIILMAALCARYNGRIESLRDYLKLCCTLAIPFLLILLQPDLGTGLVVLVSGAVVIIVAGPRRSWVLWTIGILVALVALILLSDSIVDTLVGDENSLIKTYQMNRLLVFLDPSADTTGSGYNLQQALIAVGSGGVFGKGIGGATQASLGFLPEAHTDFVFALLAEEFGFVGSALLIVLFLALIFATLRVANRCELLFGKLICIGITAMWAFQIFENIGMCLSLMPITGIPLPFISYGSSSMVAQLFSVGLVESVASHRVKAG
jgi:rod shape determining protein RodA